MTPVDMPAILERLRGVRGGHHPAEVYPLSGQHGAPTYDSDLLSVLDFVERAIRVPEPLTARQAEVFAFIRDSIDRRNCAPTYSEIRAHFGFRSFSTVSQHVRSLERKGWIEVLPILSRGIVITPRAL